MVHTDQEFLLHSQTDVCLIIWKMFANHLPQKETHKCDASDVLGFQDVEHGVSSVWKH